jgi:UDP-N-acetylmuramoylalanine--D-glutamate ligase
LIRERERYKSFSIIGAARSGIAAAKLLKKKGYNVLLSESKNIDTISDEIVNTLNRLGIESEFGGHSEHIYENDAIVISPGVPQDSELVAKAIADKKDILSEIEIASWFCKGKIIAVTGTNGKTTTTTLIGKIFEDAGYPAFVCGNIGKAFSEVADEIDEDGFAVVEVSSFQLDNIKAFKPDTAVLLNITPDHLDRYNNSFDKYIHSKLRIVENQNGHDSFVYNYDDPVIKGNLKIKINSQQIPFSVIDDPNGKFKIGAYNRNDEIIFFGNGTKEKIMDTAELKIKGEHNVYNVLSAVLAAKIYGISTNSIRKTLKSFEGVEHRLEFVRELNGIKFYNDSKATNVNSVYYAIRGFTEPIILMLGGRDKGNDYKLIENDVRKSVQSIIAFGESRNKIHDFFKNIVPVKVTVDLLDAVKSALSAAKRNYVVLFSPACASFDAFENYEHRGREFKRLVNEL